MSHKSCIKLFISLFVMLIRFCVYRVHHYDLLHTGLVDWLAFSALVLTHWTRLYIWKYKYNMHTYENRWLCQWFKWICI